MWPAVNRAVSSVFDLWLWPINALPSWLQVCLTAVPVALFALLIFRFASNQAGITAAKDKIKAYLLELWLYKDDPRVLLNAQARVIGHSLNYLRYAIVPMLIMIVPVALIIVQIESHFGFRSFEPNESAILAVTVDGETPVGRLKAALAVPDGLVAETPALRIDTEGRVLWRIRARAPGLHQIGISLDGQEVEKTAAVAVEGVPLAPARYRANDWRALGYPAEAPIDPRSQIASVELAYPRSGSSFAGLSGATWLLFAVTLLLGFALRGPLGVTF